VNTPGGSITLMHANKIKNTQDIFFFQVGALW